MAPEDRSEEDGSRDAPRCWYHNLVLQSMRRRHRKTFEPVFCHPVGGNMPWRRIEALPVEPGAEPGEREGSRLGVRLFGNRRVSHRPHPSPNTDAGAVASIRKWLRQNGGEP